MTVGRIKLVRGAVVLVCGLVAASVVLSVTAATSSATSVPPISGGSEAQRAALQSILVRLVDSSPAPDSIVGAEIGPLPEGFDPTGERTDASWIYLTISDGDLLHNSLALWQATLVAGAFRSESEARQLPEVSGRTIRVRKADGSTREGSSAMIDVPEGAPIPSTDETSLIDHVRQEAAKAGVVLTGVEFARTIELAPIVTVAASDPAQFVNRHATLVEIIDDFRDIRAPTADGAFLVVRDADGGVLMLSGYAVRAGQGLGWVGATLAYSP